ESSGPTRGVSCSSARTARSSTSTIQMLFPILLPFQDRCRRSMSVSYASPGEWRLQATRYVFMTPAFAPLLLAVTLAAIRLGGNDVRATATSRHATSALRRRLRARD